MALDQATLRESLAAVVGATGVTAATPADAVDGVQPILVVEPETVEQVAAMLAHAHQAGLRVTPRGGGTRMGWGNIPAGIDVILSTRRLDRLVEHAAGDMTATVQCGITLETVRDALAEAGQMLALDVPFAERATIGGLIATNDSGPLRLRYGGIRDLLIGLTIVRPDGVIARGGGKVVKNVAGYDLPKLFTGSLGTLGLIVEATFRLHPRPAESQTLKLSAPTPEAAGALILDVLGSTLVPTGCTLEWSGEAGCDVFLRLAGIAPSVEAQAEQAHRLAAARELDAQTLRGEAAEAAWYDLGEAPWSVGPDGIVARWSVLPTEIASAVRSLERVADRFGLTAHAIVQAHGIGHISLDPREAGASADETLIAATTELREAIAPRDGTLVLLAAPVSVKRRIDVWGPPPDSLPLMRQIKARFDPRGILNPGRFIGETS